MMTDVQVQRVLQSTGPQAWPESLAQVEPTLNADGITLQRNSAGEIRGRLYWPNGRTVDVVQANGWGLPWVWIERYAGDPPNPDPPIPNPPDPPDPPTPAECPCKEELEAIRQEINRLALEVFGIRGLVTKGLWDAKLSHKWLGTLTGTVGPMKGE